MWRIGAIGAFCILAACAGDAAPATDRVAVTGGAPPEAPAGDETIVITDDVVVVVDPEVDP
jgi:hypothetical protein